MEVLIITGACGVGKSTLSKAWAQSKQGAVIECDYFTEWIYKDDFPHFSRKEENFVADLSATVAMKYMAEAMPVAIENVWTPSGIKELIEGISSQDDLQIKVVWLYCENAENHRRDEERIPENQMKERVDIVSQELSSYKWPDYVHPIDTTHITVEETLTIITGLNNVSLPI